MTDVEWAAIKELLPRAASRGRRRAGDLREVVNALHYRNNRSSRPSLFVLPKKTQRLTRAMLRKSLGD